LGIVTALANAVFAAVTGVSIASAAVFSKIAIPQMLRYGYNIRFSSGCVAGTSALGMLIPPSLILIVYGFLANESIGQLFIAAIFPGILLTINYSLMIILLAYVRPDILGNPQRPEKMSLMARLIALGKASSIIFLVVLVLGGMYAGLFTPTEAGAVGCVGSLAVMVAKRRFNLKDLFETLMDAGYTTASVFLLVIGAMMFGRMLAMSGLIADLSNLVAQAHVTPILIVAGICIILMLMGTFLDMVSILVIAMPILLPVINQLGFDPIWFGIVVTLSIETGLVTPPFGMSVFVVKGSLGDKASLEDIYIGSLPFLLVLIVTVVLLLLFPPLATWLPRHM
jgi:tripartite ATP-independent transporter DctM subunit